MKVRADMYPYLAGCTGLISAIPSRFASGGPEQLVEKLKSRQFRQTVRDELKTGTGFENIIDYCGYDGIMVLQVPTTTDLIGHNIAGIAEQRKADPFDVFCDIIVKNNGGGLAGYFMRREDHPAIQFAKPYVMGGTDGGSSRSLFHCFTPDIWVLFQE